MSKHKVIAEEVMESQRIDGATIESINAKVPYNTKMGKTVSQLSERRRLTWKFDCLEEEKRHVRQDKEIFQPS